MIDFLTPEGAAVALAVVVPLAALLVLVRRARVVREVLGLRAPERPEWIVPAAALAVFAGLVGVAAAQPAVTETRHAAVRTDVEAFFVIDTSRSMLAASGQDGERRIDRAKAAAVGLRNAIADVPAGIASLTDRALPHLYPSANKQVFAQTMRRVVDVEHPPPLAPGARATSFDPLESFAGWISSSRRRSTGAWSSSSATPRCARRTRRCSRRGSRTGRRCGSSSSTSGTTASGSSRATVVRRRRNGPTRRAAAAHRAGPAARGADRGRGRAGRGGGRGARRGRRRRRDAPRRAGRDGRAGAVRDPRLVRAARAAALAPQPGLNPACSVPPWTRASCWRRRSTSCWRRLGGSGRGCGRARDLLPEGVRPAHDALSRRLRLLHVRAAAAPRERAYLPLDEVLAIARAAPPPAVTRRSSRSATSRSCATASPATSSGRSASRPRSSTLRPPPTPCWRRPACCRTSTPAS